MSDLSGLIHVSLINVLIGAATNQLPHIVSWFKGIYNKVLSYFMDKIYGPRIEVKIIHFSHVSAENWHPMAYVFVKYLVEEHGITNNTYVHNNRVEREALVNDAKSIGNSYIGINFMSHNASGNEKHPIYINKAIFYSRLHTKDEIDALYMKLYEKNCKLEKTTKIVVHNPEDPANNNINRFHGSSGVDSQIFDLYVTDQEIYQREHYDNIVQVIKSNDHGNFMLHGPPGTGKTNLINKVASDHEAVLIVANLKDFKSIHDLRKFLNATTFEQNSSLDQFCKVQPKIKFYLFEDFNTMLPMSFWQSNSVDHEEESSSADGDSKKTKKKEQPKFEKYTYSELLNLLDGVVKLRGSYCFFTTNHLDKIDSALYRDGRMFLMHVDLLDSGAVNKFILDKFMTLSNETWNPIPLAKLYAYKILYPSIERFITELKKFNDIITIDITVEQKTQVL